MPPTHVGLHAARIDDHARDAEWSEITRQTAHDHIHCRLRAAIGDRAPRSIIGKRYHAASQVTISLRSLRATWSTNASETRIGPMVLTSSTFAQAS